MTVLGRQIKQLRKASKITMDELAQCIGVARTTVVGYENGSREPSIQVLEKIAYRFEVSVDYLLGRELGALSTPNTDDQPINHAAFPLASTLRFLRETRGWSIQKAADKLGIPKSTYAGYESARREPTLAIIEKLSILFGVSIDQLFGREPAEAVRATQSFGDWLMEKRVAAGFKSQREFASICGVTGATLSRLESGTQKPLADTLKLIANALPGTTYEEVLQAAGVLTEKTSNSPDPLLRQILDRLTGMERGMVVMKADIQELKEITLAGAQLAERVDATELDIRLIKKAITKE